MLNSGTTPPPPPPPAQLTLDSQTQAIIDNLRAQVAILQQAIQNQDESATGRLADLYHEHYANWAEHTRCHIRPIIDAIASLESQKNTINQALRDSIENLHSRHQKLNQEEATYLAQRAEFTTIPNTEEEIAEIDELLMIELPAKARQLVEETQLQRQTLEHSLTEIDQRITQLRQNKREPDRIALQLRSIYQAIPAPRGRLAAAAQNEVNAAVIPAQRAVNIEEWILGIKEDPIDPHSLRQPAILGGIFINRLKRFLKTQEDHVENVEYQLAEMIRKYNGFTNPQGLQGLNERIIIAIATGYLTRAPETYCTSHIQFLKDALIVESKENLFMHYLQQVYQAFPELAQTASISISSLQARNEIIQDVNHLLERANHRAQPIQDSTQPIQRKEPTRVPLKPLAPKPQLNAEFTIDQNPIILPPPPPRTLAYHEQHQAEIELAARTSHREQIQLAPQPLLEDLRAGFKAESQAPVSQSHGDFNHNQTHTQHLIDEMRSCQSRLEEELQALQREKDLLEQTKNQEINEAQRREHAAQQQLRTANNQLRRANQKSKIKQTEVDSMRQRLGFLQQQFTLTQPGRPVVPYVDILGESGGVAALCVLFEQDYKRLPTREEILTICPAKGNDPHFVTELRQHGIR